MKKSVKISGTVGVSRRFEDRQTDAQPAAYGLAQQLMA
jgi:hypothetical protein